MNEQRPTQFTVLDRDGAQALMDTSVTPPAGIPPQFVLLRFNDGASVFADAGLFAATSNAPNQPLRYAGSFAEMRGNAEPINANNVGNNFAADAGAANRPVSQTAATGEETIVPVIEEQLRVGRERVVTGGVRVHKTVSEHTELVDQPVLQEQIRVEHVAINQVVAQAPQARQEGDTMIIPLVEEVIVVEKRLVLREEIRITKQTVQGRHQQEVVLRREEAKLEGIEPDPRIGR